MNDRSFSSTLQAPDGSEQAILAGAVQCFNAFGFHRTSMRQIAAAAEISVANVYNYFAAKSKILLEVLQRASAEQMSVTQAALDACHDGDSVSVARCRPSCASKSTRMRASAPTASCATSR